MKKKLILLAIVLTATLAVAQPGQGGPPQGGPGPDQRWQGPQGGGPGWGPGPGWGQGPMWGTQGRGQRMGPGPQGFGPRRMGPGPGMGMGQGRGFGQGRGQRMMGRRGMRPGGGGPGMLDQLGLTDDQRTKMGQQRLEHRKVNEKFGSDLRIKRWELEELMGAPAQDRVKIDAKLKELSDLRLARTKAGLDQRDSMLKMLTPEQREKMKELGPARGARQGRGFGPRGRQDM